MSTAGVRAQCTGTLITPCGSLGRHAHVVKQKTLNARLIAGSVTLRFAEADTLGPMAIEWFPGHMASARKKAAENGPTSPIPGPS